MLDRIFDVLFFDQPRSNVALCFGQDLDSFGVLLYLVISMQK